jgi:putative NADH-flavin reductase
MKIAILGGTGFVGKILIEKAISAGYQVVALARNKSKLAEYSGNIEIIEGNYFDKEVMRKVVNSSDAILSTIGPPTKKTNLTVENYAEAMKNLIEIMSEENKTRIITLAAGSITLKNEKVRFHQSLLRLVLKFVSPLTVPTKLKELRLLEESNLNWTTIRPPLIQKGLKGEFRNSISNPISAKVDVDDLAKFMLEVLEQKSYFKTAPYVGN